jgi:hypothetical protein
MPMDEIDQAIAREETLLTVIAELCRFMPLDKAELFAAQLIGIGAKAAAYRPETIDLVAERLIRPHLRIVAKDQGGKVQD